MGQQLYRPNTGSRLTNVRWSLVIRMKLGFLSGVVIVGLLCLHQTTSEGGDDIKVLTYRADALPLDYHIELGAVDTDDRTKAGHELDVRGMAVADVSRPAPASGSGSSSGSGSASTPHLLKNMVRAMVSGGGSSRSQHQNHHHPCSRRRQNEALHSLLQDDSSPDAQQRLHQLERNLAGSSAAVVLCRLRHRKLTKAENGTDGEKLYDYIRTGQTDSVVLLARHGCSSEDVDYNDTIFTDMQQFMSAHNCWSDSWERFYEKLTQGSLSRTDLNTNDHDNTDGVESSALLPLPIRNNPKYNRVHAMTRKCKLLKKYHKCKEDVAAAVAAAEAAAAATTTTKQPHKIGKIPPASLRYSITDREYDEFIFY